MKHKIGDMVRWTSEYDDHIVKDTGIGIVIGSEKYSYIDNHYVTYKIYRNKYNDKMSFEERNIQKLKGE